MRTLLILLTLVCISVGQSVFTEPAWKGFEYIYNAPGDFDAVGIDTFFAACTTNSFSTKYQYGALTNEIYIVDSFQADSGLTVYVQYKNEGGGWGSYHTATTDKSKLALINATIANTTGAYIFFDPTVFNEWIPADSTRFIYEIGFDDTLLIWNRIGGQ